MSLYPVYANAFYVAIPWKQVQIEGDVIRCLRYAGIDPDRLLYLPLDENPRFWREVRQLSFAFRDNDKGKIVGFYQEYGAMLPRGYGEENLNEVKVWLEWFQTLTAIVEWVKQQREAPLREMFGPQRVSTRLEEAIVTLFGTPEGYPRIEYRPSPRINRQAKAVTFATPRTRDELFMAGWEAARHATAEFLGKHIRVSHAGEPLGAATTAVTFHAFGALQAAFLQWYFQEVASYGVSRCNADDCNNPVVPPRRRFCSERCRQREKKRRQRSEK